MLDWNLPLSVGPGGAGFVEYLDTHETGSKVGVVKDPFGPSPQLLAATSPICSFRATEIELSSDNKKLYVNYRLARRHPGLRRRNAHHQGDRRPARPADAPAGRRSRRRRPAARSRRQFPRHRHLPAVLGSGDPALRPADADFAAGRARPAKRSDHVQVGHRYRSARHHRVPGRRSSSARCPRARACGPTTRRGRAPKSFEAKPTRVIGNQFDGRPVTDNNPHRDLDLAR